MANRPIYLSTGNILNPYHEENINFEWVPGYSYKNKERRRETRRASRSFQGRATAHRNPRPAQREEINH